MFNLEKVIYNIFTTNVIFIPFTKRGGGKR